MAVVTVLAPYIDEDGNRIIFSGHPVTKGVKVAFRGKNNVLTVADSAKVVELFVDFFGDGSAVEVKSTTLPRTGLRFALRLGHDCGIRIGENVGSQGRTRITAAEGTDVTLGDDCMLAMDIEIRSDDAHPLYDVRTGERLNMGQSISIGDHVWIAKHATIMGGVSIGSGSVIGYRSIVTKDVPNNSVAAGAPAKIVRHDVAWERPKVLTRNAGDVHPYAGERHEEFWNLTDLEAVAQWADRVPRPNVLEKEEQELVKVGKHPIQLATQRRNRAAEKADQERRARAKASAEQDMAEAARTAAQEVMRQAEMEKRQQNPWRRVTRKARRAVGRLRPA